MRFQPGQSGNPQGRRIETSEGFKNIREICKLRSTKMVDILTTIAEDEEERGMTRVAAIREILDRAWGKPTQEVAISTSEIESKDVSWMTDEVVKGFMLMREGKGKFVPMDDSEPKNAGS